MKHAMRIDPYLRGLLLLLTVLGTSVVGGRGVASSRFLEDFGHAGTLRTFKGQVRHSDDTPMPGATLRISDPRNDKDYVIEADEGGNFIKLDLPAGKYKIRASGDASNVGEFTVRISQGGPSTSSKYILLKLSPGCASGESGVKLVSKLKKQ